jgi:uncharacterized membrane protein YoaK (UPF0700 family)
MDMARVSSVFAPALSLSLFAGFVDAQAFLAAGGFFAAFMSGNTTRLAIDFGGGDWADFELGLALVLSFVAGVILAAVITRVQPRWRECAGMALVGVLVALAAILAIVWPRPLEPLPLAAAMGAMHAAIGPGEPGSVHPGYPTGGLVRLGRGLADTLMRAEPRSAWFPELLLWAGFAVGAALGVGAHRHDAIQALWFATLAAAALAVWFMVRRDRGSVS